mmetsp:Transcript_84498/g.204878  ORF Transcript_84498/g.204878 Transcript_84498/m.204878 type:complete len:541 (+) Transcript_84498:222-1844(+)
MSSSESEPAYSDDDYDENPGSPPPDSDDEYSGGGYSSSGGSGGGDDDPEIKIDNAYYTALEEEKPDGERAKLQGDLDTMADLFTKALANFDLVVKLEDERDEHADGYNKRYFASLQHGTELKYELIFAGPEPRDFSEVETRFEAMLNFVLNVSSNEAADAILSVLDKVKTCQDLMFVRRMSETALRNLVAQAEATRGSSVLSLIFKVRMRMAGSLVEHLGRTLVGGDGAAESKDGSDDVEQQLQEMLTLLHTHCMTKTPEGEPTGEDDPSKASQLMEVYALKLRLCDIKGDSMGTENIWNRCTSQIFGAGHDRKSLMESAVASPAVMGAVRECFGKWFMRTEDFDRAYNMFINAFESYSAAGRTEDAQRTLAYELSADMLSTTEHADPMQTKEAKAYLSVPLIDAMDKLKRAYQENRVKDFERTLRESPMVTEEPFIAHYLAELIFQTRVEALRTLIQPYSAVRLEFLAQKLNMDMPSVERLVVQLVLDGSLAWTLDQMTGCLTPTKQSTRSYGSRKYAAVSEWTGRVEALRQSLERRLA